MSFKNRIAGYAVGGVNRIAALTPRKTRRGNALFNAPAGFVALPSHASGAQPPQQTVSQHQIYQIAYETAVSQVGARKMRRIASN